jgi:hypothetical protein
VNRRLLNVIANRLDGILWSRLCCVYADRGMQKVLAAKDPLTRKGATKRNYRLGVATVAKQGPPRSQRESEIPPQ